METVRFDELELQPQILRGIKAMGLEEATPIQSTSGLWRSGDQQADPRVKRRSPDHHRYTGKSHGSPSPKNDPL